MHQLKPAWLIYMMATLTVSAIYSMTREPVALNIAIGMAVMTLMLFAIHRATA